MEFQLIKSWYWSVITCQVYLHKACIYTKRNELLNLFISNLIWYNFLYPNLRYGRLHHFLAGDTPCRYAKSTVHKIDHISKTKSWTKRTRELKNHFKSNAHLSSKLGHFWTKNKSGRDFCKPDSDANQWG